MANEIKVSVSLKYKKTIDKQQQHNVSESFNADVSGDSYVAGVQAVGTSEEELAQIADLGTPGMCIVKNLDDANFVELGGVTGQYTIMLLAGETCMFRLTTAALYALADTATCLVEYHIIEA